MELLDGLVGTGRTSRDDDLAVLGVRARSTDPAGRRQRPHPATPTRRGRGARPGVTDRPKARKRLLSVLRVDM